MSEKIEVVFDRQKLDTILSFLVLGTESAALSASKSKCFYFKTTENFLYIFTSSENIALSSAYGEIGTQMNVCFDSKKLKHLISKTKKEQVTFYFEEGIWKIRGQGNYILENFSFDSPDTFFNQNLETPLFTISAKEFSKCMEKSIFFVSDEREAPHLRNFYFDGNLVSTDRKSCQVVSTSVKSGSLSKDILIPQIFYDVCQKTEEVLEVFDMQTYFIVKVGTFRIRLPEIVGVEKFPDYQKFLKTCEEYPHSIKVDKSAFLETLERVTFFAEKNFFYKVALKIQKDKIILSSKYNDQIEEEISCESTHEIDLSLNGRYLNKALEILQNPIEIKFNTNMDVVYLKDPTSRLILLPLMTE